MKSISVWTCIAILLLVNKGRCLISGDPLARKLASIATNGMGVQNMQDYYDSQQYDIVPVSGQDLLDQVSTSLSVKFRALIEAASKIRDEVQKEYSNFPSDLSTVGMEQCCQAKNVKDDIKFRSKVQFGSSCVTKSLTSPTNAKFPTTKIGDVMRTNHNNNNNLLWQYFGSEDGTSIYYPKVKVDDCGSYDPRFRPFYSAAATTKPRDVVLVIDKSSSMDTIESDTKSRLTIVKEAARTVIQTLGPNDRIGAVSFAAAVTKPGNENSCLKDTLALATEENKDSISNFINSLFTERGADFGAALRSSFKYFSSSSLSLNGETRDQMILFLTDADSWTGTDHPLDVIRDENAALGNRVYIMTFGIGKGLSSKAEAADLLRNMSDQVRNNATSGNVKRGFTEFIDDSTNMRSKLNSYYGFFTSLQNKNPSFSVPFLDTFSNIGLVISICLPAYGNTNFLGVACADIKLSDVFAEVNIFHEDDLSYLFVIDNTGRTLHHPLLPFPRTIKDKIPLINILNLERSTEAEEVIKSMKKRDPGDKAFTSTRTSARGKVLLDGIETKSVPSHYYWKPIEDSIYSLCVVVGKDDVQQTLKAQQTSKDVFLYHRRDLMTDNFEDCQISSRWATKERAAIHFNEFAFKNPSQYLDYEETQVTVANYQKYFTELGSHNPGFKDTVFNSLVATYQAELFWKLNTDLATFAIWRFIGTKDGVFRTYPHHSLPKDYDHAFRPWWRRAVSEKGILIITAPYLDASGSGIIAALCHSLYQGSASKHTEDDNTVAVLGWDVSLEYLNYILLSSYDECKDSEYSCMLVDDSGFIVVHPDFVDPNIQTRIVQSVHLVAKEGVKSCPTEVYSEAAVNRLRIFKTSKVLVKNLNSEGDIALDLIKEGIMHKYSCTDLENHKIQYTYKIQLRQSSTGTDRLSSSGVQYELRSVDKTNVYIIIKKKTSKSIQQCCNQLPIVWPDRHRCLEEACECLCFRTIDYNQCLDTNDFRDTGSTCSAKTPALEKSIDVEEEKQKIIGIPFCFDPKCNTRSNESECYKMVGCNWCVKNEIGNLCEQPYCDSRAMCPFGELHGSNICPDGKADEKTTTEKMVVASESDKQTDDVIIALSVSIGVIVLIIISIAVICCIKNRPPRRNPMDDYLTPVDIPLPNTGTTNVQYVASPDQDSRGSVESHYIKITT